MRQELEGEIGIRETNSDKQIRRIIRPTYHHLVQILDIVLRIGEQNFGHIAVQIRFALTGCIDDRC